MGPGVFKEVLKTRFKNRAYIASSPVTPQDKKLALVLNTIGGNIDLSIYGCFHSCLGTGGVVNWRGIVIK